MKKKQTLSDWMSEIGSSKSDKKIAASMKNLERANKARRLLKQMADARNKDCTYTTKQVKKALKEMRE